MWDAEARTRSRERGQRGNDRMIVNVVFRVRKVRTTTSVGNERGEGTDGEEMRG